MLVATTRARAPGTAVEKSLQSSRRSQFRDAPSAAFGIARCPAVAKLKHGT